MVYNNSNNRNQHINSSNINAMDASILGEPFHNPYTFIPFPESVDDRFAPTALTADEIPDEQHRRSGVLELTIETLSPLLTCSPTPDCKLKNGHKSYKALTINDDVIVPSSGVRGSLRTLMTILSGGTLGYMDEDLWLVQKRDARLGPSSQYPDLPDKAFLAEVIQPGNVNLPGIIELGKTKLVPVNSLEQKFRNLDRSRPTTRRIKPLTYKDHTGEVWKVKLSGRPIKKRGKKEGVFQGNGTRIELDQHFWTTYEGRHRHAVYSKLEKGDLIWLEPQKKSCSAIKSSNDIKSLQIARWGRRGSPLKQLIPECVHPDSMNKDGLVDIVTDLFGQIPKDKTWAAGPFSARVRPGNLIFLDAKQNTTSETLAPLSSPHPGCLAFYRDAELDELSKGSPLKGYKVYRNTKERGQNAPWKYSVQGEYDEEGRLRMPVKRKMNKTAELLNEGSVGKLRISFRSLGLDELALLYAACSVDWRLGGGKPLGLGHCRVTGLEMIDEDGERTTPMGISENSENLAVPKNLTRFIDNYQQRIGLYKTSQIPVEKLRYPRAVAQNKNKSFRAGLTWFARHASPREGRPGLKTMWLNGQLELKASKDQIKAQPLPMLQTEKPDSDLIYGYDMVALDTKKTGNPGNQRTLVGKMEKFNTKSHAASNEQSGPNTSQSRQTRSDARAGRSPASTTRDFQITKSNIGTMIAEDLKMGGITPEKALNYLHKMEEFGIAPEKSNKWEKKYNRLHELKDK